MAIWTLKNCALIGLISFSAIAAAEPCEPLRWIDGDTADMRIGAQTVRVRVAGYDAPERGQPYWREARDYAGQLASRGAACDCYKADRYGRSVCTVRVEGASVAVAMAGAGLACIDPRFEAEAAAADRQAAREALASAQAQRLRMWSTPNPVCAADFRRAKNAK